MSRRSRRLVAASLANPTQASDRGKTIGRKIFGKMRPYNLRRRGEGRATLPRRSFFPTWIAPHIPASPSCLAACLPARLAAVAVACNGGWSCVKPARRSKEGTNDRRARSPGPRPGERGRSGGGGVAARRRGRQPVTPSLLPSVSPQAK